MLNYYTFVKILHIFMTIYFLAHLAAIFNAVAIKSPITFSFSVFPQFLALALSFLCQITTIIQSCSLPFKVLICNCKAFFKQNLHYFKQIMIQRKFSLACSQITHKDWKEIRRLENSILTGCLKNYDIYSFHWIFLLSSLVFTLPWGKNPRSLCILSPFIYPLANNKVCTIAACAWQHASISDRIRLTVSCGMLGCMCCNNLALHFSLLLQ